MALILVLGGGAAGAVLRYMVHLQFRGHYPWGTFAANVSGAFILGLLSGLAAGSAGLPDWVRTLVGTGFCGALTTYSTFGLETVRLATAGDAHGRRPSRTGPRGRSGRWGRAVLNAGATVVVGLAAAGLGWSIAG